VARGIIGLAQRNRLPWEKYSTKIQKMGT
jgi:hypothetical protein